MTGRFEQQASTFHRELPGFIRATLVDYGLTHEVIDRRRLGWDGACVTVPVEDRSGRVVFFERWDALAVGVPLDKGFPIELYPRDALVPTPERIVIAEGIHEALVFESVGIQAVAATSTGRFFKTHEWTPLLSGIPDIIIALRRGPRSERRRSLLTRSEVVERIMSALPQARVAMWPPEVGRGGGAFAFFRRRGRSVQDFEELLR